MVLDAPARAIPALPPRFPPVAHLGKLPQLKLVEHLALLGKLALLNHRGQKRLASAHLPDIVQRVPEQPRKRRADVIEFRGRTVHAIEHVVDAGGHLLEPFLADPQRCVAIKLVQPERNRCCRLRQQRDLLVSEKVHLPGVHGERTADRASQMNRQRRDRVQPVRRCGGVAHRQPRIGGEIVHDTRLIAADTAADRSLARGPFIRKHRDRVEIPRGVPGPAHRHHRVRRGVVPANPDDLEPGILRHKPADFAE